MSGFIGIDDKAQHIKAIYVGVDDIAREVTRAYHGYGLNGIARLIYQKDGYTGPTKLEYTINIFQTKGQIITVTVDGEEHTKSFTAPAGTVWTARIEAEEGYIPDVLVASSGILTSDTNIYVTSANTSAEVIYNTLTIPATFNQTYNTLTLTKGTVGKLPIYNDLASDEAKTFRIPYGTTYTITYEGNPGYQGGTSISGKISGKDITIKHNNAVLQYYNLSIEGTIDQTYTVTFAADPVYGGTVPAKISGETKTSTFSCPYHSTATITYTENDPNDQYIYTASTSITKIMNDDQFVPIMEAEKTIKQYTITLTGNANKNIRLNNNLGTIITNNQKLDYGTIIYVDGILSTDTQQYAYSNLICKVNDTIINPGETFTLTKDTTIDISQTEAVKQYIITLTGNANKNVRLTNESGIIIISGQKLDYGTTIYVNGSLPADTSQFKYSDLTCEYNNISIDAGDTFILTENTTIDISCTAITRQCLITIDGVAISDIRLTNATGAIVNSNQYIENGTVIYINGSLPENTQQYTYTYSSLTCTINDVNVPIGSTFTVTSDTVINITCSMVVNQYAITLTGNADKNVRLTDETGIIVTSGQKFDYGTALYIDGILSENTPQYTYTDLTCKINDTNITPKTNYILTDDIVIDVSQTIEINQYSVTLIGNANKNVRINNSEGAIVTSEQKFDYGTILCINGSLPEDTEHYTYSALTCTYNDETIMLGGTRLLTEDTIIDISCTTTTNQYTVTLNQGLGTILTVKNGNNIITNNSKVDYGAMLSIVGTLTENTMQYTFSNLALKYNSNSIPNGTIHTVTGNTEIVSTSTATVNKYLITHGETTNQSYRILINGTDITGWRTAAYTSTKYDYGSSYTVEYSANAATAQYAYTASTNVTGTITDNVDIDAKAAVISVRSYTITHGTTTNQSYRILINGTDITGWRTAAYTSTNYNYGTSYTVEYSAGAATAQYTYTASSKVTGTITGTVNLGNKSATANLRTYTVTIAQKPNQTITVTRTGGSASYDGKSSWTSTFTSYYGMTYTATVTPAGGYTAGDLVIT